MEKVFKLNVNGLETLAHYDLKKIDAVFLPLMRKWSTLYKENKKRVIVLLAAAPGVGKSTLALFLQEYAKEFSDLVRIQTVGMDGFHYPNSYLSTHYAKDGVTLLKQIKGAPESFDVNKLLDKIKECQQKDCFFPVYDRQLHEPIEDAVYVDAPILLIEGNYLLLNEEGWSHIKGLADDSIFINSDIDDLKGRLIKRKMHNGITEEMALKHFEEVDKLNWLLVNNHSLKAHISLKMDQKGNYILINE